MHYRYAEVRHVAEFKLRYHLDVAEDSIPDSIHSMCVT